jgi:hypothetical protein
MKIRNSVQVKNFLKDLGDVVGSPVKYENAWAYIDDYICAKFLGRKYLPFFDNATTIKTAGNFRPI